MRPLLFLVADKNMEGFVKGFFEREQWHLSIGCRAFDFDPTTDIRVATSDNDPGLYRRADDLLAPFGKTYEHVVVMIDQEWQGSPGADDIRRRIQLHIENTGWEDETGLALVVSPEIDIWLWTNTNHSAKALGWPSWDRLHEALQKENWLSEPNQIKPTRPKEAAEWALKRGPKRRPRSSRIYHQVASRVSLKRCTDPALRILLTRLRQWFPP